MGPVPLDNNNTVVVDDLDDVLSSAERTGLQQQLDSIDTSFHEGMVSRYTVTKVLVHAAQNN